MQRRTEVRDRHADQLLEYGVARRLHRELPVLAAVCEPPLTGRLGQDAVAQFETHLVHRQPERPGGHLGHHGPGPRAEVLRAREHERGAVGVEARAGVGLRCGSSG